MRFKYLFTLGMLLLLGFKLQAGSPNFEKYSHLYRSALLIDAKTGEVIFADRADKTNSPASLSKMMAAYIVLDQLQSGKITLQDSITVSRWASKIGGSQVYLKEKEVFTLEELMQAVVIMSANDATVAVAEHVSGSQKAFVELMNVYAKKLQMHDTVYYSPHGLPPGWRKPDSVTTAHDVAILARELIKFPQYLEWSSTKLTYFRKGTFQLLNTNIHLLRRFPGMDGLKTGFHSAAGFNLAATANRDGMRLISVVLGADTHKIRNNASEHILELGFQGYQYMTVVQQGSPFLVPVQNGIVEQLKVDVHQEVQLLVPSSKSDAIEKKVRVSPSLTAPIKAGERVGSLEIVLNDKVLKRTPLFATHQVLEKTLWNSVVDVFLTERATN